jgi:hypothetical protein
MRHLRLGPDSAGYDNHSLPPVHRGAPVHRAARRRRCRARRNGRRAGLLTSASARYAAGRSASTDAVGSGRIRSRRRQSPGAAPEHRAGAVNLLHYTACANGTSGICRMTCSTSVPPRWPRPRPTARLRRSGADHPRRHGHHARAGPHLADRPGSRRHPGFHRRPRPAAHVPGVHGAAWRSPGRW